MVKKVVKKSASKKGMSALQAIEIGAGVLAAVVTAGTAGYYFYGTKNAVQHRDAASKWAKSLKRDTLKQVKKLQKLDAKSVASAIEKASEVCRQMEGVSKKDIDSAVEELKKNWTKMKKEMEPSIEVKKAVKTVSSPKAVAKAVKKAVKSVVKKAVKKSR